MINPDISDTRESYDEMISKIDDEIARLEKEQAAIDRNKFDFNEIERLNREIDEELNKLSEDVVPEEEISDDNEGTSRVIEIK